jgi:hypothetical protein
VKKLLLVVGFAAVLAFGFGGEQDEAPVPTPAAELKAAPALPLEVTETTQPPGWNPPDTAEEQLVIALNDLMDVALEQALLAGAALLVVLVWAFQHQIRHGG